MSYQVGSLVKARGREWVVLPQSQDDLLVLRPLGGRDDEVAGIYLPLESVEPALFDLPSPDAVGDHRSCALLRDAVRLSSRATAGPFRCFGRIACEPRPYQLVPLLMALKLDPVRLLIADDVGIGKTIEACLVARELLDRGEVTRLAVLCPPHLAEQWQEELRDKFHIDAQLVLASTAGKLERHCGPTQSLFEVYPHVVVSMDFIKADRRRDEFARTAPELVIIDEAHTCAFGFEGRGGRHQRHELVKRLAQDANRHLVLVTATPHSGNEVAFRSLLGFLKPEFANLPEDLTGSDRKTERRKLAAHFVQRRRADIRSYLGAETTFPERDDKHPEITYKLAPDYRRLFERVIAYARETVRDDEGGPRYQRVRWWSALALLRSVASSPAAAEETLRNRAAVAEALTPEEVDRIGRQTVFDLEPEDAADDIDLAPGADPGDNDAEPSQGKNHRRLREMAGEARELRGKKDAKLMQIVNQIKELLRDGYNPILFCRFIPTAVYVADELSSCLPKEVAVAAVTGALPPAAREQTVRDLGDATKRVLVATDCLSEGINLQEHFNAVIHYDLSWNPTRHEQREGRVDRFGQPSPKVRVLTYYGVDNQIDGLVLDVLLRKHRTIRSSLGISVPVPVDTNAVMDAILEGLLLRRGKASGPATQLIAPGLEDYFLPSQKELYERWEAAAAREKRSRTVFAQESIKVDEVAADIEQARSAAGTGRDVQRFFLKAIQAYGATAQGDTSEGGPIRLDMHEVPRALRDALRLGDQALITFNAQSEGATYLSRTHPTVEALAAYVMDEALDSLVGRLARRAGVIRTGSVEKRTTLMLVRYRYDLTTTTARKGQHSQFVEECYVLGFRGAPEEAEWLQADEAEALLTAQPAGNITAQQASDFVSRVVEGYEAHLRPRVEAEAATRAEILREAHDHVRRGSRAGPGPCQVRPRLPADVIGIYVYLPALASGGGDAR